jgi:hypothetical protein
MPSYLALELRRCMKPTSSSVHTPASLREAEESREKALAAPTHCLGLASTLLDHGSNLTHRRYSPFRPRLGWQTMAGNVPKLKPKQEEAIVALLSNRGVEETARAVKIAPRTLYRWLKDPAFDSAYLTARRTAYKQGMARLQQSCGAAISVLYKVMADPATPAAVKVRAVECILSHSAKSIEIEDVEMRVTELERAAEIAKSSRN